MTEEHERLCLALAKVPRCGPRFTPADQVPHRINLGRIEDVFDLRFDEFTDTLFAAGDAGDFAQTLEKINIHWGCSLGEFMYQVGCEQIVASIPRKSHAMMLYGPIVCHEY